METKRVRTIPFRLAEQNYSLVSNASWDTHLFSHSNRRWVNMQERVYVSRPSRIVKKLSFHLQVFIEANGVNVLTYGLLDSSMPRVSEAIIGCLLRLHNDPATRQSLFIILSVNCSYTVRCCTLV